MGGNELNVWMAVQFKKGNEPSTDKAMIDIKEFFMSCFNSNEGIKPKMVVMDWEYAQRVQKNDENKKMVTLDEIKPDDLPFY